MTPEVPWRTNDFMILGIQAWGKEFKFPLVF